jgi:hypothetical protein
MGEKHPQSFPPFAMPSFCEPGLTSRPICPQHRAPDVPQQRNATPTFPDAFGPVSR